MYRCYLLRDGRIGMRDDADLKTINEAIARCRLLLSTQLPGEKFQGFEIWCGTSLIHAEIGAQAQCTNDPKS